MGGCRHPLDVRVRWILNRQQFFSCLLGMLKNIDKSSLSPKWQHVCENGCPGKIFFSIWDFESKSDGVQTLKTPRIQILIITCWMLDLQLCSEQKRLLFRCLRSAHITSSIRSSLSVTLYFNLALNYSMGFTPISCALARFLLHELRMAHLPLLSGSENCETRS